MVRVQISRSAFSDISARDEARAQEIFRSRVQKRKLTTPPLIGESRTFINRVSFLVSSFRTSQRTAQQGQARFDVIRQLEAQAGKRLPDVRALSNIELRQRFVGTATTPSQVALEARRGGRAPTPTRDFQGVVSAVERPTGFLAGQQFDIRSKIAELAGDQRRQQREGDEAGELKTKFQRTALEFAGAGIGTISALLSPIETIKGLPEAGRFITGGGLAQRLRTQPEAVVGAAAFDIAFIKGSQFVFTRLPPKVTAEFTKLQTKFRPVVKTPSGDVIPDIPSGRGVDLELRGVTPRGDLIIDTTTRAGVTKTIKIGGTVDELAESLAKQARLAGREVDAVSASRDFFRFLEREKVIDKPRVPGAPELEVSLFADPRGRLRPSRLGLGQQEARLIDLLSDDITFRRTKPQALFFEDVTIAKFPPALRAIENKLKKGITLSQAEQAKLLRFQLTPSGEFKPLGFLSTEPEIVLAKGNVVRRTNVPAVTVIEGQRVPIIRVEIIRDPVLSKLWEKIRSGKGTQSDIAKLSRGTKIDISSIIRNKRFISPTGAITSGISFVPTVSKIGVPSRPPITQRTLGGSPSLSSRSGKLASSPLTGRPSRPISRRPLSRRIPTSITGRISKQVRPSPRPRPRSRPIFRGSSPFSGQVRRRGGSGRALVRGSGVPVAPPLVRAVPPIIRREDFDKKRRRLARARERGGFDALTRRFGKIVRINRRPLRRQDARDLGAHRAGTSLRASFIVRRSKLGGKLGKIPKEITGFLKKNRQQFRPAKSKALAGFLVERRKFRLDSGREKADIKQARRRAPIPRRKRGKK